MPPTHPNYPPLLPRAALLSPLQPYPMSWRDQLSNRLQARRIPISRSLLALCNLNLLEYAPIADRNHIETAFRGSTDRQITALSQSLTLALRECRLPNTRPVTVILCGQYDSLCIWMLLLTFIDLTIGGRVAASPVASTADSPTLPLAPTPRPSSATDRVRNAVPSNYCCSMIVTKRSISIGTPSRQRDMRTQQPAPPTCSTHIPIVLGPTAWLSQGVLA